MVAIRTFALARIFGSGATQRTALHEVELAVPFGEVHGLLGPSGAGKTTLCRIVSTVLAPTSGRALVAGFDVEKDRRGAQRCVGVSFGGERGLYPRLTVLENLRYAAALHGVRGRRARHVVTDLLDRFGLTARAGDPVETLSRGMKQRLHLARSLVAEPSVLVVDEPSAGLDPIAAAALRGVLSEMSSPSRAVLLATHDMAEAAALCTRVSFIDRGRVLSTAPASAFRPTDAEPKLLRFRVTDFARRQDLTHALGRSGLVVVDGPAELFELRTETAEDLVTAVTLLHAHRCHEYEVVAPSLLELYCAVFGTSGLEVR